MWVSANAAGSAAASPPRPTSGSFSVIERARSSRKASPLVPSGTFAPCTIWYMITEGSISVEAPAARVWDVFTDVERWPEWTASVERIIARDGAGGAAEIAVGKRFEIKQPRLPKLVWEVTEV